MAGYTTRSLLTELEKELLKLQQRSGGGSLPLGGQQGQPAGPWSGTGQSPTKQQVVGEIIQTLGTIQQNRQNRPQSSPLPPVSPISNYKVPQGLPSTMDNARAKGEQLGLISGGATMATAGAVTPPRPPATNINGYLKGRQLGLMPEAAPKGLPTMTSPLPAPPKKTGSAPVLDHAMMGLVPEGWEAQQATLEPPTGLDTIRFLRRLVKGDGKQAPAPVPDHNLMGLVPEGWEEENRVLAGKYQNTALKPLAYLGGLMNDSDAKKEAQQQELDGLLATLPTNMAAFVGEDKLRLYEMQFSQISQTENGTGEWNYPGKEWMTDDEKATLGWLQERGLREFANLYTLKVNAAIEERKNNEERQVLEDESANPLYKGAIRVGAGTANIGTGIIASPIYAAEVLAQQMKNLDSGVDAPVGEQGLGAQLMQLKQEQGATALHDLSPGAALAGEAILSIGNNLANYALFGPMAAPMMGTQAGAGIAYDAGKRGATGSQQLLLGTLGAGAETLGEGISLKGLEKILEMPADGLKSFVLKLGAQMGTEFTEESATEVMNILADLAVMDDKAELARYYDAYLAANPGDEGQAVAAVTAEALWQILMAGAMGAVSGAALGTGAQLLGSVRADRAAALSERQEQIQRIAEPTYTGTMAAGLDAVAWQASRQAQSGQGVLAMPQADIGGRPEAPGQFGLPKVHPLPKVQPMATLADGSQSINGLPAVAGSQRYATSLIEKLQQGLPQLRAMQPVTILTGTEFRKGEVGLTDQVARFFDGLGNRVTRAGFGEVVLTRRGVKDSLAHGHGRAKAISFAAVPSVIQNGVQIDYQPDWKGRGYDTYVFAAPVEIGGKRSNVGVIVQYNHRDSRYYLHEVVDNHGNLIRIDKKTEDTGHGFKTGIPVSSGGDATPIVGDTPSTHILPRMDGNVNVANGVQPIKTGDTNGSFKTDRLASPVRTPAPAVKGLPSPHSIADEGSGVKQIEGLPSPKAIALDNRAQRQLVEHLGKELGVPATRQREVLAPIVKELSEEVRRQGEVRPETAQRLFDKAWENGMEVQEEYFNQYKDLKETLRTRAITLAEADRPGGSWREIRQKYFGSLRLVHEGGLPVDVAYAELAGQYPELFGPEYNTPIDQLERMGEVAKSIRKTAVELDAYYGRYDDEYRRLAHAGFEEALDAFVRERGNVERYEKSRRKREAEKAALKAQLEMEGRHLAENSDALMGAYKEAAKYQRKADKAVRENALTDEDNRYVDDLLKGVRKTADVIPEGLNAGGIRKVYEAKRQVRDIMAPVHELRRQKRAARVARADHFIEGSINWKDKRSGLAYSTETMERNLRDIVTDKAEAEALRREYFEPVHGNEAKATRYKNQLKAQAKALGLNKYESVYLHMYGELKGVEAAKSFGMARPDAELTLLTKSSDEFYNRYKNKIEMAKIEKGLELFRGIYDGAIKQLNAAYVANGYDPIEYRYGYWPHFIVEKDSLLRKVCRALGVEVASDSLPTDIAGMTHTFRPGRRWNPNAQQRTGFRTEYNALQGLDRYLEYAADVIYHTEDIQKLRALEDAIRQRHSDKGTRERMAEIRNDESLSENEKQVLLDALYKKNRGHLSNFVQELGEYTNQLAGKKSHHDRMVEKDFGRGVYQLMGAFESRVAANMVAMNPGSWLTNFIPIQQAAAETSSGSMLRAARDTVKNYLAHDGLADESIFLTNRYGTDMLYKSPQRNLSDLLSRPMGLIDEFTANVVTRAKIYDNLKNGMDRAAAINSADNWAASVMADRSKGALPTYFNRKNPITKTLTMFQLEANNQLRHLFKDIPKDAKEKGAAALLAILAKFFVGAYLFNDLYEYLVGRRPALDPLGIANEAMGDFTGYKLPNLVEIVGSVAQGESVDFTTTKRGAMAATANLGENVAQELPFVGGLLGGGRLPISAALPNVGNLAGAITGGLSGEMHPNRAGQVIRQELAKPLYYLVPPFGGGQIKKMVEGSQILREGGKYTYDREGNRKLQYAVENPGPADWARTLLFGPSSLPSAREWVEGGFKAESVRYTEGFDEARAAGISGDVYRQWWKASQQLTADKDDGGKPIAGSRKVNLIRSLDRYDLTPEQKMLMLKTFDPELVVKMETAAGAGVSNENLLRWWAEMPTIKAEIGAEGKVVPGSKKANTIKAVMAYDLTAEQRLELLYATSYDFSGEMADARGAGVPAEILLYWWNVKDTIKPDMNAKGNPIPGSRKRKLQQMVNSLPIDRKQKVALLAAAGVSG